MPKSATPITYHQTTQKLTFKRWFVRYRRIILSLLPFFALAFYDFSFWDDYWMAGLARRVGPWEAQHTHYMTWGGRSSLV